jgi:hypothetical protein
MIRDTTTTKMTNDDSTLENEMNDIILNDDSDGEVSWTGPSGCCVVRTFCPAG